MYVRKYECIDIIWGGKGVNNSPRSYLGINESPPYNYEVGKTIIYTFQTFPSIKINVYAIVCTYECTYIQKLVLSF